MQQSRSLPYAGFFEECTIRLKKVLFYLLHTIKFTLVLSCHFLKLCTCPYPPNLPWTGAPELASLLGTDSTFVFSSCSYHQAIITIGREGANLPSYHQAIIKQSSSYSQAVISPRTEKVPTSQADILTNFCSHTQ